MNPSCLNPIRSYHSPCAMRLFFSSAMPGLVHVYLPPAVAHHSCDRQRLDCLAP